MPRTFGSLRARLSGIGKSAGTNLKSWPHEPSPIRSNAPRAPVGTPVRTAASGAGGTIDCAGTATALINRTLSWAGCCLMIVVTSDGAGRLTTSDVQTVAWFPRTSGPDRDLGPNRRHSEHVMTPKCRPVNARAIIPVKPDQGSRQQTSGRGYGSFLVCVRAPA